MAEGSHLSKSLLYKDLSGYLFFGGVRRMVGLKTRWAALYCFVFLFIACRGGGIWCLDRK